MGNTLKNNVHHTAYDFFRLTICAVLHKSLTQRILQKAACSHYTLYYKTPLPISAPRIYLIDNLDYSCRLEYDQKKLWVSDPVLNINDEITLWDSTISVSSPSAIRLIKKNDIKLKAEAVTLAYSFCGGNTVILTLIWAHLPKSKLAINEVYDMMFAECRVAAKNVQAQASSAHRSISPRPKLNFREIRIMRLLADGLTSEEVAEKTHVTRATIYFHVKQFTKKMECSTRSQAIIKAAVLNLI